MNGMSQNIGTVLVFLRVSRILSSNNWDRGQRAHFIWKMERENRPRVSFY
jgi:hypothetical protein